MPQDNLKPAPTYLTQAEAARRICMEVLQKIYLRHVEANGGDGHSAPDEWRNCPDPECEALRLS